MIIVLKPHATPQEIDEVKRHVIELGYDPRLIHGVERTVIGAVGDELSHRSLEILRSMPMVEDVLPIQKRYKLASREFHPDDTIVSIASHRIGGGHFQVIAGPCAVESLDQMRRVARDLAGAGVRVLRGCVFKPRTSPYDFQGLGTDGLEILEEVKREFGLAVCTEVLGASHLAEVAAVADMIQIGARNCQNYHLLEQVADAGKPVLLKRGLASTIEEWLSAAEYLLVHGCRDVVLCERGIRTFERATRGTLDVSAVAVAKEETHLPVIVDPSHAAGLARLVMPLAKAGVAVGADGLIIEAHPNPVAALSDGYQQLPSHSFREVMASLRPLVQLAGKQLDG
jgi:3-deoxy-7-phosphoheptulonate synthase